MCATLVKTFIEYFTHPPQGAPRCRSGGVKFSHAKELQMERDNLIKEIKKVYSAHDALLEHVGANSVPNAKRKLDRERAEFERTKGQLQEVVNALEVDNWRNAVTRAKSLLNKLEREGLPVWLRSISPHWVGKVPPNQYKYWLRFCREQFLVALGQLQSDAELGLEVDIEGTLDAMKEVYLTQKPAEFVEAVSDYIAQEVFIEEDNEGEEEN